MTQFLNVFVHHNNSPRMRGLIDRVDYEKGKKSRSWYTDGVKFQAIKMDTPEDVVTRFIMVRDLDQIEQLDEEGLNVVNSAILLLDATEDDVKERMEQRVNKIRSNDDMEEILILIMNAAPRKNDDGILSRRQAKYFITGMDNEFQVELQYKEIDSDPSDEDNTIIWEFVENTIDSHLK